MEIEIHWVNKVKGACPPYKTEVEVVHWTTIVPRTGELVFVNDRSGFVRMVTHYKKGLDLSIQIRVEQIKSRSL